MRGRAVATTTSDVMGNIGAQFIEIFTSSKVLRWSMFWLGWLMLSPETIVPGAVAVSVGNVFYKERALISSPSQPPGWASWRT